ncbi:MAG TPA: thioredoxin family protein [Mollicutes bacterium]|nr:thioredoxin family protein [Mollicutes bacterium]
MNFKKIAIMLFVFSLIVLLIVFTNWNKNNEYLKDVTYSEIKNKVENKESFVLYIGNEFCSYCKLFEPKLRAVANEYKLVIYKIDTATMTTDENQEFKGLVGSVGTPTVVFFYDGVESGTSNRMNGNISKDKIIDKLKINDYIKD